MKRPENRLCADCHVNTHPRWTSWSLGVFICIRCSGIHRGMGTHISRVKSADLDAWTDEQTQMMVKWGNRRANKYIPNSLPYIHIPSLSQLFVAVLSGCIVDRELMVDTGKLHYHPPISPPTLKWKTS
jgi:stromal membrane-associated protein